MARLRVLELFCGIGGCAAALEERAEVVAAVDINQRAIEVYRANFGHATHVAAAESIPLARWEAWAADLWWMSPPCQPFTQRGRQRDIHDARLACWPVLLQRIADLLPTYLVLENVPPFRHSLAFGQLTQQLERTGYHWKACDLCPTQLGIPNCRRRCYLIASRRELTAPAMCDVTPRKLREFLDAEPSPPLFISSTAAAAYDGALHVVDEDDEGAVTACFTAAYGRSMVRSGSYLRVKDRMRRFAPTEIARLLGWPSDFAFPGEWSLRQKWRLLGNGLSVPAARWVLAHIPELAFGHDAPRLEAKGSFTRFRMFLKRRERRGAEEMSENGAPVDTRRLRPTR